MTRTLIAALALGLALVTPLRAERGNAELKRYCSGDATAFCADVDPSGKAMNACFRKHRKALSANCRRAIDAYRAKGGR